MKNYEIYLALATANLFFVLMGIDAQNWLVIINLIAAILSFIQWRIHRPKS